MRKRFHILEDNTDAALLGELKIYLDSRDNYNNLVYQKISAIGFKAVTGKVLALAHTNC